MWIQSEHKIPLQTRFRSYFESMTAVGTMFPKYNIARAYFGGQCNVGAIKDININKILKSSSKQPASGTLFLGRNWVYSSAIHLDSGAHAEIIQAQDSAYELV
jgi:hypothetical protein